MRKHRFACAHRRPPFKLSVYILCLGRFWRPHDVRWRRRKPRARWRHFRWGRRLRRDRRSVLHSHLLLLRLDHRQSAVNTVQRVLQRFICLSQKINKQHQLQFDATVCVFCVLVRRRKECYCFTLRPRLLLVPNKSKKNKNPNFLNVQLSHFLILELQYGWVTLNPDKHEF